MTRILHVALRDFLAIVATKGFLIGLLVAPAMGAAFVILGPILFDDSGYQIEGEYGVIDPTGAVCQELEVALDPDSVAREHPEALRRNLDQVPEAVRGMATDAVQPSLDEAAGPPPDVRLTMLPADMDVEAAKAWLSAEPEGAQRKALIVIHEDAVQAATPAGQLGAYDLFVPPGLDDRDLGFMYRTISEAIVNARVAAHSLERAEIEALLRVPRQPSTTVGPDAERQTVAGFNELLPLAFMVLMFIGIVSGGQTMLVSTVEEKSSRVVEVLLSAVSPMELMAGKLLAGVAVSLLTIGLYLALGLALLASFSLFGLFDPWLIPYFVIMFLIGFFVSGATAGTADGTGNDPGLPVAGHLPQSGCAVRGRDELPAAHQHVRDGNPDGVHATAAVVGGLAVDRCRLRVGRRRRVGRGEGVPRGTADVRQAPRRQNPCPLDPRRVARLWEGVPLTLLVLVRDTPRPHRRRLEEGPARLVSRRDRATPAARAATRRGRRRRR